MGGPRGSRPDSAARRDTRKVRDDRRARGAAIRGRALCGRRRVGPGAQGERRRAGVSRWAAARGEGEGRTLGRRASWAELARRAG